VAKKEREEKLSEETVNETCQNEEAKMEEATEVTEETTEENVEDASEEEPKKKDKKDKKDEKIAELTDKVTRQMAEFDNFRKRSEKEKGQMFDMGAKSIVEKILPIVDNFERGLSSVPDDLKENPFVDGMDKIYKQMLASLEEAGVTAIEAMDKEFDPNLHNAVMHIDDENYGENVVVEEFQKGYMYHDTVVRHSMVKVAN
jgi:molecular chaperone GrpE